ncbi:MAG: S8 family serine peptidase [Myxococcota bacterium]
MGATWLAAVLGLAGSAWAEAPEGRWLVGVVDAAHPPVAAVSAAGGTLQRCFRSSRVCLVTGPLDAAALRRDAEVRHVEPDGLLQQAGTLPPDAPCTANWDLEAIGVDAAWAVQRGADSPIVAIEDSGVLVTHQDLAGRIQSGWDYGDGDPDPEVVQGGVPEHGTFIAGIVAGNDGDAVGRVGVAPEGQLFLQKIADHDGYLYFSYALDAMDDIATNRPDVGVLSYSLGGSYAPAAMYDAVAALGQADVLVVAAAVNCGVPQCDEANNDISPVFPASYELDNVVAVASLRDDGRLDPYSHYGAASVALAAPGADICSDTVDSDTSTGVASGTSYATPVVAGIAALVRGAWPRLTADETARTLEASCTPDAQLATRIRCGGAVSAADAVAVPVVRLEAPDRVVASPTGTLRIPLDSVGAEGEAVVVVTHTAALVVHHASAEPFRAGDVLALPTGDEIAPADGTLLRVPLGADGDASATVDVEALADDAQVASVWAVPVSLDGRLVGPRVPAQGGVLFDVTTDAADPTGTEPTTSTSTSTDTTPDTAGDLPLEDGGDDKGGCGCAGAPGGASGLGGLLLLALVRRRSR